MALVYVGMGLAGGSFLNRLAGTDGPTWQVADSVEQIESASHPVAPAISDGLPLAEKLFDKSIEPAELLDDDEADEDDTKNYVLLSGSAAFVIPAGLHDSPADGAAVIPFRLRAFSNRGSPSA